MESEKQIYFFNAIYDTLEVNNITSIEQMRNPKILSSILIEIEPSLKPKEGEKFTKAINDFLIKSKENKEEEMVLKSDFVFNEKSFETDESYFCQIILLLTAISKKSETFMLKICDLDEEYQELWADVIGKYIDIINETEIYKEIDNSMISNRSNRSSRSKISASLRRLTERSIHYLSSKENFNKSLNIQSSVSIGRNKSNVVNENTSIKKNNGVNKSKDIQYDQEKLNENCDDINKKEIEDLKNTITQLKEKNMELGDKLNEVNNELDKYKSKNKDTNKEEEDKRVNELQNEVNELKNQIKEKEKINNDYNELVKSYKKLQNEKSLLQVNLNIQKEEMTKVKNELEHKDKNFEILLNENGEYSEKLNQLKRELEEIKNKEIIPEKKTLPEQNDLFILTKQYGSAKEIIKIINDQKIEITKLKCEIDNINRLISELNEENTKNLETKNFLYQEKENLRCSLENALKEIESDQNTFEDYIQLLNKMKSENEKLKFLNEEKEEKYKSEIKKLKEDKNSKETKENELKKAEIAKREKEIEIKLNEIKIKEEKISKTQSDLNIKDNDIKIKLSQINKQQDQINKRENEINAMQIELSKKQEEINNKLNDINKREKEIEEKSNVKILKNIPQSPNNKHNKREKSLIEKELSLSIKNKETQMKDKENEITQREKSLNEREKSLNQREEQTTRKESDLYKKEQSLYEKEKYLNNLENPLTINEHLYSMQQKISDSQENQTIEELKEKLRESLEKEEKSKKRINMLKTENIKLNLQLDQFNEDLKTKKTIPNNSNEIDKLKGQIKNLTHSYDSITSMLKKHFKTTNFNDVEINSISNKISQLLRSKLEANELNELVTKNKKLNENLIDEVNKYKKNSTKFENQSKKLKIENLQLKEAIIEQKIKSDEEYELITSSLYQLANQFKNYKEEMQKLKN